MTGFPRAGLTWVTLRLFPLAIATWPIGASGTQTPASVIAYVAREAVAIGKPDAPIAPAEAAALRRTIAGSRIIGFGEVGHGSREPLEYRNRLIRHLVAHEGLTAVAIESGITNTRAIGDWVAGGPGDPAMLLRQLSWGFGNLGANLDLVHWLRTWNAAHPSRPVHFYGTDASVLLVMSTAPELDGTPSLDAVATYLEAVMPADTAALRVRLANVRPQLHSDGFRALDAAGRERLSQLLSETNARFRISADKMRVASGNEAFEWADRAAFDLSRLPGLLGGWTTDPRESEKILTSIDVRDRTMADHAQWLLSREGPHGRILVFAANGHITASPMVGSVMRQFRRQPVVMGTHLRSRMGKGYRSILTASSRGRGANDPALGSIDRAFVKAGKDRAFMSLATARPLVWWTSQQSLAQGEARIDDLIPAHAADAMLFIDTLTPVPPPAKASQ